MGDNTRHNWTPARLDRLPLLVEAGLTAAAIAQRLGGGITRNAVVGKCRRLGLQLRRGPAGALKVLDDLPPLPEPPPEPPKATPIRIEPVPGKDPRLCIAPGCGLTRMAQNLHNLCQRHDQERIAAKRNAA